ncbi:hypothetical protein [Streptomyces sp. NPDC001774]
MTERITVDRHLYLTEDRCRLVEENDPAARWLYWAPGMEVPRELFERLLNPPVKRKRRRPAENK